MGSPVAINKAFAVQPDSIDDQSIAFVMADGFSVPGRLHLRGMRRVETHMPQLRIICIDHHDLRRRLNKIEDGRLKQESGHARRLA